METFQEQDFATQLKNEKHLATQTLLFLVSLVYLNWSVLEVT